MKKLTWDDIDIVDDEKVNKGDNSSSSYFHILKADDDKRLVFGWALVSATKEGQKIIDWQGDIVEQEDLEEAAYEYVLNFRDAGEEHIGSLRKKARMVESVVFTEEKLNAMGIPLGTVPYGWWIGFYVDDDNAWNLIKNGTYKMFSIEGRAIREPVNDLVTKFAGSPRSGMTFAGLMKANPYHGKDGRFTTAGGAASFSYQPGTAYKDPKARSNYSGAVASATMANDGSTTKVGRTTGPKTGYMVAVDNDRGKIYEVSNDPKVARKQLKDAVSDFMDKNKDILSQENKYLGTWIDKSDGKVYLDVSTHVKSKSEAIKLGKQYDQIAIWDNKNCAEISTGGSGAVPTSKSFYDILKFNPYHDRLGRFSSAGGAASFTYRPRCK